MEHHNVSEPAFDIPKHKVSKAIVHPEYHEEGERAHNVYVDGQPVGFVERKRIRGSHAWSHKGYARDKWAWVANGGPDEAIRGFGHTSSPPSQRLGSRSTRKDAVMLALADVQHSGPQRSWEEHIGDNDY